MELDADYLDRRKDALRARWRFKLAALAVCACVAMLGDLVVEARSLDDPEPAGKAPVTAIIAHAPADHQTDPAFKRTESTLSFRQR
ncbi:hypothetical protein [Hoeflea poritis]|uniref:Uncharacterized protein n=1 Tax=Hoeflea poritis TaxID=2993659 RepID=A0ABT4VRL2_9HYPH|nr:hypothetical protein [Hoeflea poritis]MDA4847301.1 hypothetical protein [Hoeflea poritis]